MSLSEILTKVGLRLAEPGLVVVLDATGKDVGVLVLRRKGALLGVATVMLRSGGQGTAERWRWSWSTTKLGVMDEGSGSADDVVEQLLEPVTYTLSRAEP